MKTKIWYFSLLLLFGCVSDDGLKIENQSKISSIDPKLLKAFDFVNQSVDKSHFKIENQLQALHQYAINSKLASNQNQVFLRLDKGTESISVLTSRNESFILSEINSLNQSVNNSNSEAEALSLINNFKVKISSNANRFNNGELAVLKESAIALEFLFTNPTGKVYSNNIKDYSNSRMSNLRATATPAECVLYISLIAYYSANCVFLNPVACALLAYYSYQLATGCGSGGGGGNPCAGSTDPCCGITCIAGYVCNGGQCVVDYGYTPPACPEGSFWNGSECIYQ